MADDNTSAEPRATVALVKAMVGTVDAKVTGVAALVQSEGAATREAIARLTTLPETTAKLQAQNEDQEKRLAKVEDALEHRRDSEHTWARVQLPTLLLSAAVVLVGLGDLIVHIVVK